jgi:hypothetical protein
MSFGPESKNPRELRSYAQAMLAKARKSHTAKDFFAAAKAVQNAGTSKKSLGSGFEGQLANIERKIAMPDIMLGNRTECRLLDAVASAYRDSDWSVSFQGVFGRPETSPADRETAEQFLPIADGLSSALFRAQYQPSVSDERGWRKPGTLDSFEPFVSRGRQVQEIVDMTFLVALQPEVPMLPEDESVGREDSIFIARQINNSIIQARLMAELILGTFEDGDLDKIASRTPNPNTTLYERYLAQRDQLRESIVPYMANFESNLQSEFIEAVYGSSSGHVIHPEWTYHRSGNIGAAYSKLADYKNEHTNLPWQGTSE